MSCPGWDGVEMCPFIPDLMLAPPGLKVVTSAALLLRLPFFYFTFLLSLSVVVSSHWHLCSLSWGRLGQDLNMPFEAS